MANCRDCDNTGLVHKRHRENKYAFVFRCPCVIGMSVSQNFVFWSPHNVAAYEDLTQKDLSDNVSDFFKQFIFRLSRAPQKTEPDQELEIF